MKRVAAMAITVFLLTPAASFGDWVLEARSTVYWYASSTVLNTFTHAHFELGGVVLPLGTSVSHKARSVINGAVIYSVGTNAFMVWNNTAQVNLSSESCWETEVKVKYNFLTISEVSDDEACNFTVPNIGTPILIDLRGDGLHLTGLDESVWFDIDADGSLEEISWSAGSEDDVFLAFDRNGNGAIDDGSELFGNHTPLSSGELASNGFEALYEFDLMARGGNADGTITSEDRGYTDLMLWLDRTTMEYLLAKSCTAFASWVL